MRRITKFVCRSLLVCAPLAGAHHEEAGSVYAATLAADFEHVSGQLVQLAEAMPEEVYAWRPAEGVRSTSEAFMHVAGANMLMPPAFGVAPAEDLEIPENPFAPAREWEAKVTAKADVMARPKESIDYARGAIAYARSNGVTPPWSQPLPEAPPEGEAGEQGEGE